MWDSYLERQLLYALFLVPPLMGAKQQQLRALPVSPTSVASQSYCRGLVHLSPNLPNGQSGDRMVMIYPPDGLLVSAF